MTDFQLASLNKALQKLNLKTPRQPRVLAYRDNFYVECSQCGKEVEQVTVSRYRGGLYCLDCYSKIASTLYNEVKNDKSN